MYLEVIDLQGRQARKPKFLGSDGAVANGSAYGIQAGGVGWQP